MLSGYARMPHITALPVSATFQWHYTLFELVPMLSTLARHHLTVCCHIVRWSTIAGGACDCHKTEYGTPLDYRLPPIHVLRLPLNTAAFTP